MSTPVSSSFSSVVTSEGDNDKEQKTATNSAKTHAPKTDECIQVPVIYWEMLQTVDTHGETKAQILRRQDFTWIWPGDIASATIGDLLSSIADFEQVPRKDLIFARSGKEQDPGTSLAKFHAQCTTMRVERRFRICKWCNGQGVERCTE
jgi:hypothetical protein